MNTQQRDRFFLREKEEYLKAPVGGAETIWAGTSFSFGICGNSSAKSINLGTTLNTNPKSSSVNLGSESSPTKIGLKDPDSLNSQLSSYSSWTGQAAFWSISFAHFLEYIRRTILTASGVEPGFVGERNIVKGKVLSTDAGVERF